MEYVIKAIVAVFVVAFFFALFEDVDGFITLISNSFTWLSGGLGRMSELFA